MNLRASSQPSASVIGYPHLQAVIFDWAGTLVDHGSLAPTQIFVDAFATFGIALTLPEARGPMGLSKRDHIRTLLEDASLQAQWRARFDRPSTDADIDAIYERFMPMQIDKVGRYSQPIPGAVETLDPAPIVVPADGAVPSWPWRTCWRSASATCAPA